MKSEDFILSKILNKRSRIDDEIFILLFICFILNNIILIIVHVNKYLINNSVFKNYFNICYFIW